MGFNAMKALQYRLSLIGFLGVGRCFYNKSMTGFTLLFLREGSSSRLLETYRLLLFPSLYLALALRVSEDWLSIFSFSLAIQLLSLSTLCMASLYLLFISSSYLSKLSSLPMGCSSYCSISTIFLSALTSCSCLESYFLRS